MCPKSEERMLPRNNCGEPVENQCPEGEEAYFQSYPDVAEIWKPKSAYSHWKKFGNAEGRGYFCYCTIAENKVGHKPGFVVVAIFKNEAMNFAEWVTHYLWQGASHFYLFDNNSTDDWVSTVSPEVLSRMNVTR